MSCSSYRPSSGGYVASDGAQEADDTFTLNTDCPAGVLSMAPGHIWRVMSDAGGGLRSIGCAAAHVPGHAGVGQRLGRVLQGLTSIDG